VRRLHWREADLAAKNAQIDQEPLALADALADPTAHAYRRVIASGTYDRSQSIVVAPVSRGLEEGARVLTPLLVPGPGRTGLAVVVDRGWIPSSKLDAFFAADLGTEPGPVQVIGLAFLLDVGDAVPGTREPAARRVRWARFDPSKQSQAGALQAQVPYRLAPLLLQAQAAGGTQLPVGGFERPTSPVDHRSYAITWFSMAAIALATWVGLGFKQGRDGGTQEPRMASPPDRVS
jgi:surfeit locus 1 family protein